MIVSAKGLIYHVTILPQTPPLPSRLPHNTEQSSLGYIVGALGKIMLVKRPTFRSGVMSRQCQKGTDPLSLERTWPVLRFNVIASSLMDWEQHIWGLVTLNVAKEPKRELAVRNGAVWTREPNLASWTWRNCLKLRLHKKSLNRHNPSDFLFRRFGTSLRNLPFI